MQKMYAFDTVKIKILMWVAAVVLVVAGLLVPAGSVYVEDDESRSPVSFVDENGEKQTTTDYEFLSEVVESNLGSATYVVNTPIDASKRINVTGDTKFILCDGMTLNANDGIYVSAEYGGKLTIYGQSDQTGTLNATASDGSDWAGIGGGDNSNVDSVTIINGNVTAQGGDYGAGITALCRLDRQG